MGPAVPYAIAAKFTHPDRPSSLPGTDRMAAATDIGPPVAFDS
jgi:hypothetical protein